ncbi:SdiA-regulated domain-containing protein [Halarcobacter anaerophilus]|uniref:SdiA-regulated domain-containing protein n=1 Tax=Halarcobacter anaerophilus TaxID=877500 RepID=UPI0005C8CDEF|nr:SdiA-regulated domain-containing protein [Halarcobacter anaerophilus]
MNLKKLLFSSIFFYFFLILTDLNDIIYANVNDIKNISSSLKLQDYKVDVEAKELKFIENNLSGITYNKDTDTLFAITNKPRDIYEITLNGDFIRKIELTGFKDTEDITYLYDGIFAVIDEKKAQFFVFYLDKNTEKIDISNVKDSFRLKINSYKNFGYEGISYDKKNDTIFIVNEKFPLELIKIKNFISKKSMDITFSNKLTAYNNFMGDFSSLFFENRSSSLLFLSDESKMIAEVDSENGAQISFLQLKEGFLGLKKDIPQAEGISMDNKGNLYIVSEPNLFYIFKRDL